MSYLSIEQILRGQSAKMQSREMYEQEKRSAVEITPAQRVKSLSNPLIWGPPQWFSLHVMSANYPENPNAEVQRLMICRIKAIPIEVPCDNCRRHAQEFIDKYRLSLEEVCKSRLALFTFFFDFHNAVNERLGKKPMSFHHAWDMYTTPDITFSMSWH